MTSIEEELLTRARDSKLRLRFSLSNRERLTGSVIEFDRFDLKLAGQAGDLTVLKKDVSYISFPEAVIEAPAPPDPAAMADKKSRSRVQDEFLARYVKERTLALLTFVNGEEYLGVLEGFDGFTVLLKAGRGQVLAYKHGLLGIGPGYRRREAVA